MEIIDCHVHLNRQREGYLSEMLRIMDRYEIAKAIVFPGTEILPDNFGMARAIGPHRDRFFPFAWINPILDPKKAVDELRKLVETYGFLGMKFHPLFHSFYPNREYTARVVEQCIDYGIPILVHSGHAPYSTPFQIAELADDYPEATIIMDHMGLQVGWVDDAIKLAKKHPNIILGTTAMPFHEKIRLAVRTIGAERVIFGSDAPSIHPMPEMEKVRLAELSPEEMELVMGKNVKRLLKLA